MRMMGSHVSVEHKYEHVVLDNGCVCGFISGGDILATIRLCTFSARQHEHNAATKVGMSQLFLSF